MTARPWRLSSLVVVLAASLIAATASTQACSSAGVDMEDKTPVPLAGAAGSAGLAGQAGTSGKAGSAGTHLAGHAGSGAGESGQAGAAGQAGQAGAGGDGLPAWTSDPALWQEVPAFAFAAPQCRLYESRPGVEIPDAGWSWTSCGPGCEKAEVLRDGKPVLAALGGVQGAGAGEVAAIKWGLYWKEQQRAVQFFSKLEDGRPLLALRSEGGCVEGNRNINHPLYVVVRGPTPEKGVALQLPGYLDFDAHRFFWGQPFDQTKGPITNGKLFIVDGTPGVNVLVGNALGLLDYAGSGKIEVIEQNPNLLDGGYSGDLAVFADYTAKPAIIRGWSNDGLGPRTLVEGLPGDTTLVGVGPKFIVGLIPTKTLSGQEVAEGRVWWVPRTKTLSKVAPTLSAPLPDLPALIPTGLTSSGDYVVFQYTYQPDGINPTYPKMVRYFLHTTTGKLWKLEYLMEGTPERVSRLVFQSEEYFVVGRTLLEDNSDQGLRTLYRYRMSEIEKWAEPVPSYGP